MMLKLSFTVRAQLRLVFTLNGQHHIIDKRATSQTKEINNLITTIKQ